MLSLRVVRRFGTASHIAASTIASANTDCAANRNSVPVTNNKRKSLDVDEPALIKLKNERDPEKLFNLFKANASNKIIVENRFAFEDTVSRLAGARRFDYIESLLEQQKALPQGRREGFIVRIIMLYGKAGMTQQAVNTFYDMHLYGCRRTVKSFNATLRVLIETRDLNEIESFLRDVPVKFDIVLDLFSVNIIVKAFCEMGLLDKACLLMVEAEKLGVSPDVVTYTTLISAFYKVRRFEIGNGLWNLMVLKGCFPNLATFNVRIQFLINIGRAWEANKLLGLMRGIGITPDEVTYNLVIKGFCRAGYLDMAKRIYSDFHLLGYKANVKIYQTMIHYLCRAGDYDLAYKMCKNSMKNNWFPSLESIHKLLEGLWKNEKRDKAINIITLSRKKVPPFTADQLRNMQSILSKS